MDQYYSAGGGNLMTMSPAETAEGIDTPDDVMLFTSDSRCHKSHRRY